MHLARFPRESASFPAPTPLEHLDNLTKALGGPDIWIKREDATLVATGGNKVRKLEWLMGEAKAQGATHIVTQGAVQSNHVRQTAAVARKCGMTCTALLEHRIETNDRDYLASGNVLLDKLFGCNIEYRPGGIDMNAEGEKKAEQLRAKGEKVYFIPGGGSNPVGALGYVSCAQELMAQADEMGLRIDRIVHRNRQRGDACGTGRGPGGHEREHPGARDRRAAAEGPAGSERSPPRRRDGRVYRHEDGDPARVGCRELRLCRRRLWYPDRRHG